MFTHAQLVPRAPVSRFVEQLWLVRANFEAPQRMMLLPDGAFVVIFNFGASQALCARDNPQRQVSFRRSWVSGEQAQPLVIEQRGCYDLLGIAFRAGGALPFFPFGPGELAGKVIELEAIWGSEARRLREELGEQDEPHARLARLEQWLALRLRDQEPDRRVQFAAARLRAGRPGDRIRDVAEVLGVSHKHLVAEFARHLGVTPRFYARVGRLQRTIARVGFTENVDWAGIAPACGFSDQSHLINEFRDLTGLTPSVYARRRSPFLGYLNMA